MGDPSKMINIDDLLSKSPVQGADVIDIDAMLGQKKNSNSSASGNGLNGQSKPSSPTQSPSQSSSNVGSPENNFGMKSFSDLAKGQQDVAQSTQVSTQPQVQGQVGFQKAADAKKQQQQQDRQTQAIDNATQRSLK